MACVTQPPPTRNCGLLGWRELASLIGVGVPSNPIPRVKRTKSWYHIARVILTVKVAVRPRAARDAHLQRNQHSRGFEHRRHVKRLWTEHKT